MSQGPWGLAGAAPDWAIIALTIITASVSAAASCSIRLILVRMFSPFPRRRIPEARVLDDRLRLQGGTLAEFLP